MAFALVGDGVESGIMECRIFSASSSNVFTSSTEGGSSLAFGGFGFGLGKAGNEGTLLIEGEKRVLPATGGGPKMDVRECDFRFETRERGFFLIIGGTGAGFVFECFRERGLCGSCTFEPELLIDLGFPALLFNKRSFKDLIDKRRRVTSGGSGKTAEGFAAGCFF